MPCTRSVGLLIYSLRIGRSPQLLTIAYLIRVAPSNPIERRHTFRPLGGRRGGSQRRGRPNSARDPVDLIEIACFQCGGLFHVCVRDYRGQGVASAAVASLATFLCAELGATQARALAQATNHATDFILVVMPASWADSG